MTTETVTNEAAERLRALAFHGDEKFLNLIDEALAAERRATVERIRERALALRQKWGAEGLPASLRAILDEEAQR